MRPEEADLILKNTVFDTETMSVLGQPSDKFVRLRERVFDILSKTNTTENFLFPYTPTERINIFHLYLGRKAAQVQRTGNTIVLYLLDVPNGETPLSVESVIKQHIVFLSSLGVNVEDDSVFRVLRESVCIASLTGRADLKALVEETAAKLKASAVMDSSSASRVVVMLAAALAEARSYFCIQGQNWEEAIDSCAKEFAKTSRTAPIPLYLPLIDLKDLIYLDDDEETIYTKLSRSILGEQEWEKLVKLIYRLLIFWDSPEEYGSAASAVDEHRTDSVFAVRKLTRDLSSVLRTSAETWRKQWARSQGPLAVEKFFGFDSTQEILDAIRTTQGKTVLREIVKRKSIRPEDAESLLGVPRQQATRVLESLEKVGLLVSARQGEQIIYRLRAKRIELVVDLPALV